MFFHQYQDRLDKTAVGEYLGREKEYENGFCIKVLHEYVDVLEFANMVNRSIHHKIPQKYCINGLLCNTEI